MLLLAGICRNYSDTGSAPNALLFTGSPVKMGVIGSSYTTIISGGDYTLSRGVGYWVAVECTPTKKAIMASSVVAFFVVM